MANTLSEESRERKVGVRQFLRILRSVIVILTLIERLLRAILARKRTPPNYKDLDKLGVHLSEANSRFTTLLKGLADLVEVFKI